MNFKPASSRPFDPSDPPRAGEWVQIVPTIERPTVSIYPERRLSTGWIAAGVGLIVVLSAIVFWPRGGGKATEKPTPPATQTESSASSPPAEPPPVGDPATAKLVLNWDQFVEQGGVVKGSVHVTPGEGHRVAVTENDSNSLTVKSSTTGTAGIDWKYFYRNDNEHEVREIGGERVRLHPRTTYFPVTIRGAKQDSSGKVKLTLSAKIYSVNKERVESLTLTAEEQP